MAFGGVETGRTKAKLAPSVAPSAGGTGETPAAVTTAIAHRHLARLFFAGHFQDGWKTRRITCSATLSSAS